MSLKRTTFNNYTYLRVVIKPLIMATINFNLKVITGKRTELEVHCYPTSVNEKIMNFTDSEKTISDLDLSDSIEVLLKNALIKFKSMQ